MKRMFKPPYMICILTTILFVFLIMPSLASAGIYSGGFPAANVQNLHYVLSGGNSYYQTNIMSAGANLWNGLSSKVSVSLNSSGTKVSIYKSTTGDGSDLGGETFPYYMYLGQLLLDTSLTNIWYCVDIYGYDTNMTNAGLTDIQKRQLFGHEMGHTLSLSHWNVQGCIMYPSVIGGGTVPNSTDIYWLQTKWGA